MIHFKVSPRATIDNNSLYWNDASILAVNMIVFVVIIAFSVLVFFSVQSL